MNKEEKNSNKCPICGRPTHKESKYCIFHASAEEKTEEEFKNALKKYIEEIKKDDKAYDFERFIFVGDIHFKKDLNITIFGNANFRKTTFNGCANFKGATFEAGAYFTWCTFNGPAFFSYSTFEAGANFTGATFNEHAFFSNAAFPTGATFTGATFKKHAYFTFTTFNGHATFDEANFKGDVSFYLKNLLTYLSLNEIKVLPGKKLSINVNNGKNNIYFQRACLENACLDLELCEDVFIDLTDTLLRNTKIKKDQIKSHILQEKEKKFSEAKEIYLFLKNNFHSIGRYEGESWAYTKERDMERMSQSFSQFLNKYKKHSLFKKIIMESNVLKRVITKTKIFSKWLFSKKAFEWIHLAFSNFIYQYGESPRRVIRFALIIIFLFAFFLNFSGIANSDRTNMIIEFIKKSQGNEYTLRYLGATLGNFLDCLYFSVVTFTTLGYGDFQPLEGWSRFLVSSEALLGAFTMALFVYTFARRTGGR